MLAPAALAVAACVGLGISAFENDLSGREFGWRQLRERGRARLRGRRPPPRGGRCGRRALGPPLAGSGAAARLPGPTRPPPASPGCCGWAIRGPCRSVGGRCSPGLAYALTPEAPPRRRAGLHPGRSGPGQPGGDAVDLAVVRWHGAPRAPAGLGRRALRRRGRRALGPVGRSTVPPSVSAPPPAGLAAGPPRAGRPAGRPGRARRAGLRQRRVRARDGRRGARRCRRPGSVVPGAGGRRGLAARCFGALERGARRPVRRPAR